MNIIVHFDYVVLMKNITVIYSKLGEELIQ